MTALRPVPLPRRGSGPITCCGGHRAHCLFGRRQHRWATWYADGQLQRTGLTYQCMDCDGVCVAEEDGDHGPVEFTDGGNGYRLAECGHFEITMVNADGSFDPDWGDGELENMPPLAASVMVQVRAGRAAR